jgi:hypothetical protein
MITSAPRSTDHAGLQFNHAASSGISHAAPSLPMRVPAVNPFIPSEPVKVRTPRVELVVEDSDDNANEADNEVVASPELTEEEKMDLDVLHQQFSHLIEAVKSKKLTGAVKVSHAINALRLAAHLSSSGADLGESLADLLTSLYKLAWDYTGICLESEPFGTLVDVALDNRSSECSKVALQVLLVLFERDARVSGGSVRVELFDPLYDVIAASLTDEDDFVVDWGLWFVS